MTSIRTTRRHAIIAIAAVWVLVLAGLTWATRSAVELERYEARSSQERAWEDQRDARRERLDLASWRLDRLVQPILSRETERPFNHFRRYYLPADDPIETDPSDRGHVAYQESPLYSKPRPEWVLLHFETYEGEVSDVWSSPQVDGARSETVTLASMFPASERMTQAQPEHWLADLEHRYTPGLLEEEYEKAVSAGSQRVVSRLDGTDGAADDEALPGNTIDLRLTPGDDEADFVSRGTRLFERELKKEITQCVREAVRLENLGFSPELAQALYADTVCWPVYWTGMTPLWLESADDDQPLLAFLRLVLVELGDDNAMCMLQGVLLNWEWLRGVFEGEIHDLAPEANVVPMPAKGSPPPAGLTSMMALLPVRLELPEPDMPPLPEMSDGLRTGLLVAWIATCLALLAITYGTMKYVTDAERRLRFASAVTHELRTPLTSFQLYSDLLLDMPDEDVIQRRKYAQTLRNESQRLARLVENVLAYSRIGDSTPDLHRKQATPAGLLDAARSAIASQCEAAGKELVVEDQCDADLVLETDPEFVTQILANLVENACKYSAEAEDHHVWLIARQEHHRGVSIEVDDAGPGVHSRDRHQVFQPFRRSAGHNAKRIGGVGLGLALARYWAICLGGRLTLHRSPRNRSRYSCFVLNLPAVRISSP